jgi:uroporphyrinogen decarboxylase
MADYRFLKACRREPVDVTPVWIMRQAGRYLPEYQKIRGKNSFLTMCKTPELAAEVTVQPIERLGVDAAILFSDILIPVEAMGVPLEFHDGKGPVLGKEIRGQADVDVLVVPDPTDKVPFVMEAIRILRRTFEGKVPLIGFSGAPFTLASYIVEGGTSRNFIRLKTLMYQAPNVFRSLMVKIVKTVVAYLNAQIEAGAQAVQLFDTWAGILTPGDYEKYALPYTREVVESLNRDGVPVIHYANDCATLLPAIRTLPVDVIAVDWRIPLDQAAAAVGGTVALQGNMDPTMLFLPPEQIEKCVRDILLRGQSASSHIFNLGHGILPPTNPEHAVSMVEAVHRLGRKG